jgi:hypothetical protein
MQLIVHNSSRVISLLTSQLNLLGDPIIQRLTEEKDITAGITNRQYLCPLSILIHNLVVKIF